MRDSSDQLFLAHDTEGSRVDTPELSLFYKILIFVEDKGQATLNELAAFGGKRQTLGALGRLEGLRFIDRVEENDSLIFILSEKGDDYLSGMIANVPREFVSWDEKWRIILFDIPESRRTVRQMFRLKLVDFGARMLQSSVWVTPYATVADKFAAISEESGFREQVHIFEANHSEKSKINVARLWNLPQVERTYDAFFKYLESHFKSLSNKRDASYEAKCLIVTLAHIAKNDPQLPPKLMPNQWIGYEAQAWYKKLRAFCN